MNLIYTHELQEPSGIGAENTAPVNQLIKVIGQNNIHIHLPTTVLHVLYFHYFRLFTRYMYMCINLEPSSPLVLGEIKKLD